MCGCLRRSESSVINVLNNSVTTIARSGAYGEADGPGLSATFSGPYGARWHCSQSSMLCGVLVADNGNSAVRFVAIEAHTATAVMTASRCCGFCCVFVCVLFPSNTPQLHLRCRVVPPHPLMACLLDKGGGTVDIVDLKREEGALFPRPGIF